MEKTRIERITARVLPVSPDGEILLLHGWDPAIPDVTYWFSIGGACEPGESLAEAAARELLEETGIAAAPEAFGAPIGTETGVEFDWGEFHLVQDQSWFALPVPREVDVHFRGLEALEVGTIDRAGWWTPEALEIDGTAAAGDALIAMMRRAIEALRS